MSTNVIESALQSAFEAERNSTVADALNILKEASRKAPSNDLIEFHMARLLEKAKSWAGAFSLYQNIGTRHEALPPDVAQGMGRCLVGLKKYDRAAEIYEALRRKNPNDKDTLLGLGVLAKVRRNYDDAQQLVQAALQVEPDFQEARYELAQIMLARDPKDPEDKAVNELERNVRREDLHGDSLDAWMLLLKEKNREKYLQDTLEELSRQYPQKVEFVFGFGVACNRAGEITLARPALARANELLPNNGKILYEMGLVERVAGYIELSQDLILQSLKVRPDHPAGLRTFGVDHKYDYGDEHFQRLNRIAANLSDMDDDDQVQMHFALGKAFDDVKEYDASFAHFAVGGAKKRKSDEFNERANARLFGLLEKLVNKDVLQNPKQKGYKSDVPVFILGMPRSGTSLMEQILSSHPDIFGAGELKIMTSVLENIEVGKARLRMGDVEPSFDYDLNATYSQRGERYVEQVMRLAPEGKEYRRIVDKMPGNFNFVGLIHLVLPEAKIIHSRRHPVETCLSCYRIHFAEGHQWTYNLRELGRYYRRYWNLMEHWRSALPGVMYEARYEDNVADVEGSARKLIDYLGLPWDDNCLNFHETDRPVKTASASQVRKPIYNTSVNRWRRYEQYLEPLLEEIGDLVESYEKEIAHLAPPQKKAA